MTAHLSAEHGLADVHSAIGHYYTQKVETHGPTPLGVDWPCRPTQELRFVQLLRLCDFSAPFSLNDVGCGYGAMLALLARRHRRTEISYLGVDLSTAMIAQARRLWQKRQHAEFIVANKSPRAADYSVASGIFNVKLDLCDALWAEFIAKTLAAIRLTSRRGFAVNFLAPLAEDADPKAELYRAPPALWSEHCEREFGAKVELLDNYGMREYTLLVRLP